MRSKHLVMVIIFCALVWVVIILYTIMSNTHEPDNQQTTSYAETEVGTEPSTGSYTQETSYSHQAGMSDMSIEYETKSDVPKHNLETEIDMSSSVKETSLNYTSDIDWSGGEVYQSQLDELLDITTNLLYNKDNTVYVCYLASSDEVVDNSMLNDVGYFVDVDGTLYLNLRIVHMDKSISFKTVGLYYDTNIIRLRED